VLHPARDRRGGEAVVNLGGAIGDLLPAAIGVAISPIPIVATVLMLMSERPRTAPAFAAGWVAGLAVAGIVVLLVANPAGVSEGGGGTTGSGWVKIALGVLFLALARRAWRSRPAAGEQPQLPRWLAAIDRMPPQRAAAIGAGLAAINPKNLALTIAGALSIAQAGLSTGGDAAALAIFVAIASVTVAGPVIAFRLARTRVEAPLLRAKDWLAREQATVMVVLFLLLAAVLIGKGVAIVAA
jgi:Sap, sulfolipid-1-addressing protein